MTRKGYKRGRERFVNRLQDGVRRRGEARLLDELSITGNNLALNAILNVLRYIFSLVVPLEPSDRATMLRSKGIRDDIRAHIRRRLYLFPAIIANYVAPTPEAGVEDVLYQLLAGRLEEFIDLHTRGLLLQALPTQPPTQAPAQPQYQPLRQFQVQRPVGTELMGRLQPEHALRNNPFGEYQAQFPAQPQAQDQPQLQNKPYGYTTFLAHLSRQSEAQTQPQPQLQPLPHPQYQPTRQSPKRQRSPSPATGSKRPRTDKTDDAPLPVKTKAPASAVDPDIDPALEDYVSPLATNEQQTQQQPQKQTEEEEDFETSPQEQAYLRQLLESQKVQQVAEEQPETPTTAQSTQDLTPQEEKLGMSNQNMMLLQQSNAIDDQQMEVGPVTTWTNVQQTQGQVGQQAEPRLSSQEVTSLEQFNTSTNYQQSEEQIDEPADTQMEDPIDETMDEPMDQHIEELTEEQMQEAAYEEVFNALMNVDEMEE
ncbi:hypothetical protein N7522_002645 [Penicillium canescens]|nr:hypothetical protein N7522_002645 [Penicillium canescens]